jgi:DNA polymerase-3 subunit gamma/tau
LSHLTHVLAAEHVPVDGGALRLLSRAARGSMRDALSLTDQAIAFGAGTLTEAGVRQMLGSVDRGHVVAILDALIAGSGAEVVAQADGLRSLGLSAAGTLEDLAGLLQQMAVAQAAPAALDAQDPDTAEAERLAALLPADEIQLMYSMALHGRQELSLAPDEYAGLLMVLLRMLAFRPAGAASTQVAAPKPAAKPAAVAATAARPLVAAAVATAVVRAPLPVVQTPPPMVSSPPPAVYAVKPVAAPTGHSDRLRPRAVAAAAPVEVDDVPPWLDLPAGDDGMDDRPDSELELAAADADVEASYASTAGRDIALQPTPLGERWQALIAPLGLTALTRELAMQAHCIGVEDQGESQTWTLRVERDSLRQPALKDKLQTALVTALQRQVVIVLEPGVATDSPALRDAADAQARQRAVEKIVLDDPLAQALMAQFKTARIVPGSIRSN